MNRRNGAKPTSAGEWRRPYEEGEVVELPSGFRARLRPVAVDSLIAQGEIPDMLTPIAARMLYEGEELDDVTEKTDLARGYMQLINQIVPAAFLEPRVVDEFVEVEQDDGTVVKERRELGEGEIGLSHIDFADKLTVFQLAINPVEVLRRFRRQQEADVAAGDDGEADGESPE